MIKSLSFLIVTFFYGAVLNAEEEVLLLGPPHSIVGPFITNGNTFNCNYYSTYSTYCQSTDGISPTLVEAMNFDQKWKLAFGCEEEKILLRRCILKKAELPDAKLTAEVKNYLKYINGR